MRSFWSDPYLWIHLAGIATLPIWLELCLLGLAVGDPLLPVWLEIILVGIAGIAPILWMQWQRPFYIFSLVAIALKPEQLTEDQRRLLTLFKSQRHRILAVAVAVVMLVVLQKLYYGAAIASTIAPFGSARWLGLLLAAIAFLGANLFLQVPVSVISVMLTSDATFASTPPYAIDQIRSTFSRFGFPVNQILPPIVVERSMPISVVTGVAPGSTSPVHTPPMPTPPSGAGATTATPTTADSNDADDIWGTSEEVSEINLGTEAATIELVDEPIVEQPDEKPDLASGDMETEEVKTEEDIF
ncbi:MAG: low-complexity tail membrane protein [Oscillatoriales cyanobacterium C42_A2020_001]|nr:low-complexity tail membrane protein [Leptolyngbyaceae cyanobacterium C42_A2020_001]